MESNEKLREEVDELINGYHYYFESPAGAEGEPHQSFLASVLDYLKGRKDSAGDNKAIAPCQVHIYATLIKAKARDDFWEALGKWIEDRSVTIDVQRLRDSFPSEVGDLSAVDLLVSVGMSEEQANILTTYLLADWEREARVVSVFHSASSSMGQIAERLEELVADQVESYPEDMFQVVSPAYIVQGILLFSCYGRTAWFNQVAAVYKGVTPY